MLTEKQAWLKMAELWRLTETNYVYNNNILCFGLCTTLYSLCCYGIISKNIYLKMQGKIPSRTKYVWPSDLRGARKRAGYCLGQASLIKE